MAEQNNTQTLTALGKTFTVREDECIVKIPSDFWERIKTVCTVGGVSKLPKPGKSAYHTHKLIFYFCVAAKAARWTDDAGVSHFGMEKHDLVNLLTGVLPASEGFKNGCGYYCILDDKEYIALIDVLFGKAFSNVAAYAITATKLCKGVKPGEYDSEGFPVPVEEGVGFAWYLIASIKLMRKMLAEKVITELMYLDWAIRMKTVNLNTFWVEQGEAVTKEADRLEASRSLVDQYFNIRLGDPLFPGLRVQSNERVFDLPKIDVPGIRDIPIGEPAFWTPAEAKERMLEITGGIDLADPNVPKVFNVAGGGVRHATDRAVDKKCPLYEMTDVDLFFSNIYVTPEGKHIALEVAQNVAGTEEIIKLIKSKFGEHCVISVIERRSVITIYIPNFTHSFQIVSIAQADGNRIMKKFDFTCVKMQWLGGENFVMDPSAYLAMITRKTRMVSKNGWQADRIVKAHALGYDIIYDERLLMIPDCAEILTNAEKFKDMADKLIWGRQHFECKGDVPTEAETKRFTTYLKNNNPNKRIAYAATLGEAGSVNRVISELNISPNSIRASYMGTATPTVPVTALKAPNVFPLPTTNGEHIIRKAWTDPRNGKTTPGGLLVMTFNNATLLKIHRSTEPGKDGYYEVEIIADVMVDVVRIITEMVGTGLTSPIINAEGNMVFYITKKHLDGLKSAQRVKTVLATNLLAPLDIEDKCDSAEVAFMQCHGDFIIVVTIADGKKSVEFQLQHLRLQMDYVSDPDIDVYFDDRNSAAAAPEIVNQAEYEEDY